MLFSTSCYRTISPKIKNIDKLTEKDYIKITLMQNKSFINNFTEGIRSFNIPLSLITSQTSTIYLRTHLPRHFIKISKTKQRKYDFEYVFLRFCIR